MYYCHCITTNPTLLILTETGRRDNNDETNLVQRQFVLDVVGAEIRKMWDEDDDFQPELMREPYVSRDEKR